MVLLEAQASGVPVVGSELGGIPEAIRSGETGLLAQPRDAASLASCLHRLLVDDVFALRCSRNGPAHVAAAFDIRACTAALEQQLLEMVSAPYRRGLRARALRELRAWPG
jgi:colanic acid/amylovoran biosynthesis glycosyltransferase